MDTPAEVSWYYVPGEPDAHAFIAAGPGWSRSACGSVRWTVLLRKGDDPAPRHRCPDCVAAITRQVPA